MEALIKVISENLKIGTTFQEQIKLLRDKNIIAKNNSDSRQERR